jgi:hypothetical protein
MKSDQAEIGRNVDGAELQIAPAVTNCALLKDDDR